MGILDFFSKKRGQQAAPEQTTPPPATAKKILIVEDDAYIRDAYAEILTGEGYEVNTADNGMVGLDLVKSYKPNLILLDLMLPIMDGKQMLVQVRKIPEFKTLPVIILTNAGTVENERETTFYNNADAFFIKSNVNPGEIVDKVKKLIDYKI